MSIANYLAGTAATSAPVIDGSVERKANAASTNTSMAAGGGDVAAGNAEDTDDNAANFVAQTVRVPQNAASTAEP